MELLTITKRRLSETEISSLYKFFNQYDKVDYMYFILMLLFLYYEYDVRIIDNSTEKNQILYDNISKCSELGNMKEYYEKIQKSLEEDYNENSKEIKEIDAILDDINNNIDIHNKEFIKFINNNV